MAMMTFASASARMIFASERARSSRAAGRGEAGLSTARVTRYTCRRRDARARAKDKSKDESNGAIDEFGKARALRSVARKRAEQKLGQGTDISVERDPQELSVNTDNVNLLQELDAAKEELDKQIKERETIEEKFAMLCEDLSQQAQRATDEAQRLQAELVAAREIMERQVEEKDAVEAKFSMLCEDLSQQSQQATDEASRLQVELTTVQEFLDKEIEEKEIMEEKFAMLCEDLSQQAQQATAEAERLQAELTAAKESREAAAEAERLQSELTAAKESLEAEMKAKDSIEEKFAVLCEDLSQQAQQATGEAERLQSELTAAKESLEAEMKAKDSIEEKFAMLCEDLSQQAQQATGEAERLQSELTAAKESLEAEMKAKDSIEEKFAVLCEDLSNQAQQATAEAERLQAELTAAKESREAAAEAERLQSELTAAKESLEAEMKAKDSIEEKFAMLCEDLSNQAQQATAEAERLQSELTAAKESLEAEMKAKDSIEEKFAMLCEDLSNQAQQATAEAERLQSELTAAKESLEAEMKAKDSIEEKFAMLCEDLSNQAQQATAEAERLQAELTAAMESREAAAEAERLQSELTAAKESLEAEMKAKDSIEEKFAMLCEDLSNQAQQATAEAERLQSELTAAKESLEAEMKAKDSIEEKFAVLCEDLSNQAQQATAEAERLQAELTAAKESREAAAEAERLQSELTAAKESLEAEMKAKDSIEEKFAMLCEDLSNQAQQATAEAERLQSELTAAKESLEAEMKAKDSIEEKFAVLCEDLSNQAQQATGEAERLQSELTAAKESLEAEMKAKDSIEEKFAMLCEDLSNQAQQATAEAERLQAELTAAMESREAAAEAERLQSELTAAKESLEAEMKAKDSIEEKFAMLCEDLSQQAQQATAEAQRLQVELDLMTSNQPNVSEAAGGDIELFEQLVAAQKEELEVLRQLTDSSAQIIKDYERKFEDLIAERDSALQTASKAAEGVSVTSVKSTPVSTADTAAQPEQTVNTSQYVEIVRRKVREQLIAALEAQITYEVDKQESAKASEGPTDAKKSIDGVYYIIGDVRSASNSRIIYNRETTDRMSRDGQVFFHYGFDKWALGVPKKIGMTPLAHDAKERDVDHRVRDGGDWWVCDFKVHDDASVIDFVFSDAERFYDNNNNRDYHCLVESEVRTRDQKITDRLKAEMAAKRESIDKSADRAASRAENHLRMKQSMMLKHAKVASLKRVHTEPFQPRAGGEVTIYYRLEGSPFVDSTKVYCSGSWNRGSHPNSFGPTLMQCSDATPGTLQMTVNVPPDAHVLDFRFANDDVSSSATVFDSNNGTDYHVPVTGGSGIEPKLNIVHVAVEMAPIAKVGGMGDVVTALARATQEDGHDVEVIVPHYDCMSFDAVDGYHHIGVFKHDNVEVDAFRAWVEDVSVVLLRPRNGFFDVGCIYGRHDDHVRFGFFTNAALSWMRSIDKKVDVIHAHDWQTAPATWGGYPDSATALTVHNLQFGADLIRRGMESCDIATTVSPTYADEVRSHHAVAPSREKFVGIRNGIDTEIWNPSADQFLPANYAASDVVEGKRAAAKELCERLGLQHPEGAPIVGVVSRLTAQKGIHLIKHACHRALQRGASFVLLGSAPDPAHQHEFNMLAEEMKRQYPGRSGFMFKYDEPLSHLIYAGCDFLLVPSMFEPCGLTQMIAMRYGAVPVVRRTGGLRDTVFDVDNDSARCATAGFPPNGFVFDGTETSDMDYALDRALDAYYDVDRWTTLRLPERAMKCDWSWLAPAEAYADLYWRAVQDKRGSR